MSVRKLKGQPATTTHSKVKFFYPILFGIIIPSIAVVFNFEFNSGFPKPPNFPKNISLELSNFVNWADEVIANDVWTVYPKSAEEIVILINWAKDYNYTVRASGAMHSWSPLTVNLDKNSAYCKKYILAPLSCYSFRKIPPKIILVKTQRFLNNMQVINADPGDASFWAEPGVMLEDLLKILESRKLGFSNHPAVGGITLGGALAVAGHGTGVPAENETLSPGHTFGSLSNLIMAFTAIVYDDFSGKYTLKEFQRSDVVSGAFLAHLGKTIVTNVTMRAGPLQHLRCQSFIDISAEELFGQIEGLRTISKFLNTSGRIEVIWFPFTANPWLKVWTVEETKPGASTYVSSPYNYPFTDRFPQALASLLGNLISHWNNAKTINRLYTKFIPLGLTVSTSWDIWGPSRNVFSYIRPTTLKMTEAGWAIVTSRGHVEKVLRIFYQIYTRKLENFSTRNSYPINGPLCLRVTGVDNPADVRVDNAQTCGICPGSPVLGRPELDTVIWFNILTFRSNIQVSRFVSEIQNSLDEVFDESFAVLRVEWSKGFAYSSSHDFPWTNDSFLKKNIPKSWTQWESTRKILNSFDPFQSISQGQQPCFEVILEDSEGNLRNKKVDWGKDTSRNKFTVMMTIMSKAHELLQEEKTITRRDLYYENVNLYGDQSQVDKAIQELAVFLEVEPSALPFVPSAKGLMAAGGNLKLTRDVGKSEPVSVQLDKTGTLIQRFGVIKKWGKFRSNAKFVLIVEKDAIFYRLTEEDIFNRFEPFILVTGKGYPDKATRAFVSKLSRDLKIPSFVLVDADPYGLEIASIYKWGSVAQQKFPHENLSLNDLAWIREAEALRKLNFKTEIEAVASLGWAYLCNEYLYNKIVSRVSNCSMVF
ncbi:unnamed protein product [Allacma fusca]|uniref:DNA topoisomerase (ATP-hydrolyzing) n=1 Tax=Allacma fusca TaxID=39272 RepID=A0A8J2KHG2_9HEXA|nr:unnamed protein product [Allacma fusca]